ncbi:MAG: PASTA domain-containing protein [Spirochaetaceae bacterium]|nr:PASTA domain-containing protein [Spirochaetaceae bacterium]
MENFDNKRGEQRKLDLTRATGKVSGVARGAARGAAKLAKSAAKTAREQHKRISEWTREQKRTFVLVTLLMLVLFFIAGLLAFFLVLRGEERTMVPDVRHMELADALVRLQERELYPRLVLRFTDNPQDRNLVLDQSPVPGSIVKAGRRITLTVSKGAVIDKIEDYRGKKIEDVRLQLQAIAATSKGLVTLREPPLYLFDDSPAGTILDQNPKPGTEISGPTVLDLVVSKGPEASRVTMPSLIGLSYRELAAKASALNIVLEFSMRQPKGDEQAGVVVGQSVAPETAIGQYERVKITVTSPVERKGYVAGVFEQKLPDAPYAQQTVLEAVLPDSNVQQVYAAKHPGGVFSAPFFLPSGSTLVLKVNNSEVARREIR